MTTKPTFGNLIASKTLNKIDKYMLITMKEPWKIIDDSLINSPTLKIYNNSMDIEHLETFADSFTAFIDEDFTIVGLGGGTACDTAKYIAWKMKEEFDLELDLILIPSIISVDAFLCSSIAIRADNKVKYIGESRPKKILIDYDIIKEAPPYLNRAGVSDTISITSALGDWKLERDEVDGKFDRVVFQKAKQIVSDLMDARKEIRDVSEEGIKALVNGLYEEVVLCESWGNSRPEEGSEHFLAYCLESITGDHYIHGNLIGMTVLISLFLQEEYAEFSTETIKAFFDDIQIKIKPEDQNIKYGDIRKALKQVQEYIVREDLAYSIYSSPRLKLNKIKIDEVLSFLKDL
ncbi:MAG: iron-containing alcohol dehydrogenase [Promethearchaeia archaeon]